MAKSSAKRRAASRPSQAKKPAKRSPKPPKKATTSAKPQLTPLETLYATPERARLAAKLLAAAEHLANLDQGRAHVGKVASAMAELEAAKPGKATRGGPPELTAEELALRQTLRDAWRKFTKSDYRAAPKPLYYVRAGSHEHFAWLYSQPPSANPRDPKEIVRLLLAHEKYLERHPDTASAKPKRRAKGRR